MWSRLIAVLAFLLATCASAQQVDEWWKDTIVYQIYPRSFQDTTGDGVGDLKGIESRLDYFVDLGIETIWLSPVYKSPMKDFGYDISDFRDIDPLFGDLEDFADLVEAVHARDMKIIMDFIPNHSSDEHEWFNASVYSVEPYTDYYVWLDPSGFEDDGTPIVPNNWLSRFRYTAWEWNDVRQQFYLHKFIVEQPDLNYRNPVVRTEMNDILLYWLDLGADGFRFDAVLHLYEDEQFRDEPLSGTTDDPDDYYYLDHIYTYNLPETKEIGLNEMYQTIKNYAQTIGDGKDRIDMLEAWEDPYSQVELFQYSDFPFNLEILEQDFEPTVINAETIQSIVDTVVSLVPDGKVANWVLGNHDRWRVADRSRVELIDAMNMLSLTLPGVAVTYQGEEIGMVNNFDISYEESVDPAGCNCGPDNYLDDNCSRDPERTPMQWDDSANAGFTDAAATPWLPINDNYPTLNVQAQINDPASHLGIYKQCVQLRKNQPVLKTGDTVTYRDLEMLSIVRHDPAAPDSDAAFATVINFGLDAANIDMTSILAALGRNWNTGLVSVDSAGSPGGIVDLNDVQLAPAQAVVLQLVQL